MRHPKQRSIHQKRRFGNHQKRTKKFHNAYLPYLPMTLILFLSVFFSGYNPKHLTLAYATEISHQNLLASTNFERNSHGKSSLALNQRLNDAAQAKANDMVSKNYWSHNSPDGKEPWVFINVAGYSYQKAGENLAYGFSSSSATVDGWMNSPAHRDNMLDGDFQEVGFGFANSSDYNNTGAETVVVAMYGKPFMQLSQPDNPVEGINDGDITLALPGTTDNSNQIPFIATTKARSISRIESVINQTSPVIVSIFTFMSGFLVAILLVRHGVRLRKLLVNSQNFITHHPLIDATALALVILCLVLTRTIGTIL